MEPLLAAHLLSRIIGRTDIDTEDLEDAENLIAVLCPGFDPDQDSREVILAAQRSGKSTTPPRAPRKVFSDSPAERVDW